MNNNDYGHYTTQAGLMGIIGSQKIWATNIKFLNDEGECQHAIDLIKEIVPTSKIKEDHPDYEVYKQFSSALESDLDLIDDYLTQHVFTFSFSQETDLLSQWRGYCPGNNGFCLVFNTEEMFEQIKSEFDKKEEYKHDDIYLVACIYEREDKEEKIRNVINRYWFMYLSASEEADRESIIMDLLLDLRLFASYFKHPAFSEEKEKRIIVILNYAADSNLKFREGRFSLIPYIELPISRECVNRICIGPTLNKKLSERSLEIFLEKNYSPSKHVEVDYSVIPYRSL
jgi:hypothetical protein